MKCFIALLIGILFVPGICVIDASDIPETIVFNRVQEPREKAFSILIPRGWQIEGGIYRQNPLQGGGPGNAIAAKLDFAVKKDNNGTVMVRWLPEMLYVDMRRSPAGQMGFFQPGSNYMGMTVMPLMSAGDFINTVVIPYSHPNAVNMQIIKATPLNQLAENYRQRMQAMMPMIQFSYNGALIHYTYDDGGVRCEEKAVALIEDWGEIGAGMWGNKETFFVRAPKGEIEKWAPVFEIIQQSVIIDPQWLAGEMKGQLTRSKIVLDTQREVQRIENEMVEHRRKTYEEINNDMYLTLTEQEEYVNPYTGETEIGSNLWDHRWINESGDVIYTDNTDYDPNIDTNLNRSDFKRTPIRKRQPH